MAALCQWLCYSGARDEDGEPVASGSVYFLRPGTTSSTVTVYSDAAGEHAITQPVALDAGGRAKVFLNAVARVKVLDASGAEVVTVTSSDASNTIRAEQVELEVAGISGINPDTGATEDGAPTTLDVALETLAEDLEVDDAWVRLMDYATGDGTTDDTTAFQTAITTAMGNNKGLWLDPGTYCIYSTLAVTGATGAGLVIKGANRATCIIKNMDTSNSALNIDLSSAIESHIELSNFTVTANTTSSGKGILITNGDGVKIERVNVALHRIGIDTTLVSYAAVENCLITSTDGNSAGIGIRLGAHGTARKCRITSCATGTGFVLAGTQSTARDCRVTSVTTGTAFSLTGTYSSLGECSIGTATSGISLAAAGAAAVGCIATAATTAITCGAADTLARGCTVTGATTGVSVGAFARVKLVDNNISGNTTDLSVNASATELQDRGNTWTNVTDTTNLPHAWLKERRIPIKWESQSATDGANRSITPVVTTGISYHRISLTGTVARDFTLVNTSTTGLVTGDMMIVDVFVDAGSSWTQLFGAQYLDMADSSIATASGILGNSVRYEFIWNVNGSSKWNCRAYLNITAA